MSVEIECASAREVLRVLWTGVDAVPDLCLGLCYAEKGSGARESISRTLCRLFLTGEATVYQAAAPLF